MNGFAYKDERKRERESGTSPFVYILPLTDRCGRVRFPHPFEKASSAGTSESGTHTNAIPARLRTH